VSKSRSFAARWALRMLVLCGPVPLVACDRPDAKSPLNYAQDAKRAYDEALEEFKAHNWLEAQNQMREVKRKYSYSRYARLAELRIADADFEQDKFAEAIRQYKQFVHDHRSDNEEVAYARSKMAEAEYKQIAESFFLPSGEERDQASVLEAYKELRSFIADYPASKESQRLRELLADVTARLIRHELYAARFYLGRGNYAAAVARVDYALQNYALRIPAGRPAATAPSKLKGKKGDPALAPAPADLLDSGLEAEALLLLGEVYLRMRKYDDARSTFKMLMLDYPKSGLVTQAQNYLAYMQQLGV
jgi:outer membrane protein assembly factor BamD